MFIEKIDNLKKCLVISQLNLSGWGKGTRHFFKIIYRYVWGLSFNNQRKLI